MRIRRKIQFNNKLSYWSRVIFKIVIVLKANRLFVTTQEMKLFFYTF